MRIIDENGRLFSKINLIDFLVIILLLSLLPMFYYGCKIFNKKSLDVKSHEQAGKTNTDFIEIMIKGKLTKLTPEIIGLIFAGDKELDGEGKLMGTIVSLGELQPYFNKIKIGNGLKIYNKVDPYLKQMDVVLNINAGIKNGNIYYKDSQILEGNGLMFSPERYSAEIEDISIINDGNYTVENPNEVFEDKVYLILKEELSNVVNQMTDKINNLESKIEKLDKKQALWFNTEESKQ